MYKYEIYRKIAEYSKKNVNRLHMPGHKNLAQFKELFPIAPIDITELSYSDDLNCPTAEIAQAQSDIAQILGAKCAYITTDGSTSGVMAMVYVASKFGNKLIVPRNSHKSVFNACRILNVEPVIVQGSECEGVLLPPDAALVEGLIANDKSIAGIIITSPDYYGNVAPLEEYATILAKYGRLLLCDGAHGAHLAFGEDRAYYCGVHADMWVDGAHKTLATLTQGAIVCVNKPSLIPLAEEALSIFRTTSPSYPIMASVEVGVKYLANHPECIAEAKTAVATFKSQLKGVTFYPAKDWAKLAIDCKALSISPELLVPQLEKRGIYAEMNDGRYLLFYLSPTLQKWQLKDLHHALMPLLAQRKYKNTFVERQPLPQSERTYSFLYSLKQPSEWVPLKDSIGRMCAENAGITPPCLPIIIAGEIISPETASLLEGAKETFGIVGGKIKVVKK